MYEIKPDVIEYVRALATKSVCKRRGVACMVIDKLTDECLGWGVNGPAGYKPDLCSGIKDGCGCAHSEINTILSCQPRKRHLLGHSGIMIATRAPCVPCATAIVNCGFISELVYLDPSDPGAHGLAVLRQCGIEVRRLDDGRGQQDLRDTAVVIDGKDMWVCAKCGGKYPEGYPCPKCG